MSPVVLTQTDTTVGFLSQSRKSLLKIKKRDESKAFITVYANFKALKTASIRIPNSKKNLIRRSKKSTFILKNQAFRVAPYSLACSLLNKMHWSYSSSANESGKKFDRAYCEDKADIIIEDKNSLVETRPSSLLKINNKTIRKLR